MADGKRVRCVDCKFWHIEDDWCEEKGCTALLTEYCSKGEKTRDVAKTLLQDVERWCK